MKKISLDKFHSYIFFRLKQGISNSKVIFAELQSQGFENSYSTFYRYLKNDLSDFWKKQYKKNSHFSSIKSSVNLNKYKRAVKVETEPGIQAQVDWGHFGEIILNEKREKLYCFVYVLSFSRASYIEFTTNQKLPVFEQCHINAFKKLGIPKEIVYDNAKTIVLYNEKLPDGTRRIHLNLTFADFANYYGFEIIVAPPYWPRYKGKVEAHIKYIRNNFMHTFKKPKNSTSLEELNLQAQKWVYEIANNRLHSNTEEKPIEDNFRFLNLNGMLASYERLIKEAIEKNLSFADFIENLQASELNWDEASRLERWTKQAGFEMDKTIDNFDFSYPTKINKALVLELASCRFIEKTRNVAFLGPTGVGKTHLATAFIFTSNKSFSNWNNAFGDNHTSATVLDRITQHMEPVDIDGPSYRLKDRLGKSSKWTSH